MLLKHVIAPSMPLSEPASVPMCLYKLAYDQTASSRESAATTTSGTSGTSDAVIHKLPSPSLELAFRDDTLDHVRDAWRRVIARADGKTPNDEEYLNFEDREGAENYDDDEVYA